MSLYCRRYVCLGVSVWPSRKYECLGTGTCVWVSPYRLPCCSLVISVSVSVSVPAFLSDNIAFHG